MKVLVFELGGRAYALRLESIERILAHGEPAPGGCPTLDLGDSLGLAREAPGAPQHRLLLTGRGVIVRLGRLLGAARIEPEWILPLPGYIFRVRQAPLGGLIVVPPEERRGPERHRAHQALLLDERVLAQGAPARGGRAQTQEGPAGRCRTRRC